MSFESPDLPVEAGSAAASRGSPWRRQLAFALLGRRVRRSTRDGPTPNRPTRDTGQRASASKGLAVIEQTQNRRAALSGERAHAAPHAIPRRRFFLRRGGIFRGRSDGEVWPSPL